MLPRERITRALGHLTEARVPSQVLDPVLRLYTRAYGVDMSEAVTPDAGFATFNEFFTRRLREGVRPIDADPHALISPSDGRLDDGGPIDGRCTFAVKRQTYDVATLLASETEAAWFAGGSFAVVYLSPRDYHRVHSPATGVITRVRHIPGTLFPVNELGVRSVPQLFARNERVVIHVRSDEFGRVAVVMVGAMIVGRIVLAFDGPARPAIGGAIAERSWLNGDSPRVARGDELGAFELGSTVVMLLERGPAGATELDARRVGQHVHFGEAIARRPTP